MANEELIYSITRAVYGRLGAGADEHTVEQLVTDVYRAVEPLIASKDNVGGNRLNASDGARGVGTSAREGEAREEGSA